MYLLLAISYMTKCLHLERWEVWLHCRAWNCSSSFRGFLGLVVVNFQAWLEPVCVRTRLAVNCIWQTAGTTWKCDAWSNVAPSNGIGSSALWPYHPVGERVVAAVVYPESQLFYVQVLYALYSSPAAESWSTCSNSVSTERWLSCWKWAVGYRRLQCVCRCLGGCTFQRCKSPDCFHLSLSLASSHLWCVDFLHCPRSESLCW